MSSISPVSSTPVVGARAPLSAAAHASATSVAASAPDAYTAPRAAPATAPAPAGLLCKAVALPFKVVGKTLHAAGTLTFPIGGFLFLWPAGQWVSNVGHSIDGTEKETPDPFGL